MRTQHRTPRWPGWLAALALAAVAPAAAHAQCDPTFELCPGGYPFVGITPEQKTTDSTSIGVTVTWYDPDGLGSTTRQLIVNGQAHSMAGWTYTPQSSTRATSKGQLIIGTAGGPAKVNTVQAVITDPDGHQASADATFTYQPPPPPVARAAPSVTLMHHVDGYRNTAMGSHVLGYSTPSYVSLDEERSLSLAYVSGQALPVGYVAVDVKNPGTEAAWRYSLTVRDAATGVAVTHHRGETEAFFDAAGRPVHRLGALWLTGSQGTGDYKYNVVVKTYWSDSTSHETVVPVRILIVNETGSRFGAGWSLVGWQRLYGGRYGDGVTMVEGDGTARFFTGPCAAGSARCTFTSPPGEFSSLEYRSDSTGVYYLRTYPDGSRVRLVNGGGYWVPAWTENAFGHRTTFSYAAASPGSLPTEVTDPAGKKALLNYGTGGYLAAIETPGGRISRFSYQGAILHRIMQPDSSFALDSMTAASGHLVSRWRDARGQLWGMTYKVWPLVRSLVGPPVNGVRDTVSFVTPQEASLRFAPASTLGTPLASVAPDSAWTVVTDPLKHQTRYRTDGFGNVLWSSSHLGDVTTASFDANGLPRHTSAPSGETSEWRWSARGELTEQLEQGQTVFQAWYTRPGLADSTRAGGRTTHYRYGPGGEVLAEWTGTHADSATRATVRTYSSGRLTGVTSADGVQRALDYYQYGWYNVAALREWTLVGETPQWVVTYYGYDAHGRLEATNGPNGYTNQAHDRLNRPMWRTAGLQPNQVAIGYGYTGADLTSVWDQEGKEYRYTYDALGRVTTERHPNTATRTYTYNRDGLLTSRTDRRGWTVSASYDGDHRVTRQVAGSDTTTFSYRTYPAQLVVRNAVSTDTLDRHYIYPGHLYRQVSVVGGRRYEMVHRIDEATGTPGELSVEAYNGATLAWRGDILSGVTLQPPTHPTLSVTRSVTNMAGRTTTFGYDKAGRLVETTYPTGQLRHHAYDYQRRPGGATFSNSLTLSNATGGWYYYDALGRVESKRWVMGDTTRHYAYDIQGRLTGSTTVVGGATAASEVFAYDRVGNRMDHGADTVHATNRLSAFDGWTMEYDAEGNLVRKTAPNGAQTVYYWNALGQLIDVTGGGVSVDYYYNGLGQRVARQDWGGATYAQRVSHYVYHGGNLLAEIDGDGNPLRTYTYNGTDNPVSVTVGNPSTGTSYYYVNEQPGHVVGLLSQAGTLVNLYRYKAFGEHDTGTREAVPQAFGFMARERDARNGLYYVRARWYDAHLGRFISEDPLGVAAGMNTYAYAGNDPVNFTDPSGLCRREARMSVTWHFPKVNAGRHGDVSLFDDGSQWYCVDDGWVPGTDWHTPPPIDMELIPTYVRLLRDVPDLRTANMRVDMVEATECSRLGTCPQMDSWAVCTADVAFSVAGGRAVVAIYKGRRVFSAFEAARVFKPQSARYRRARAAATRPLLEARDNLLYPSLGGSAQEAFQQSVHGEFDLTGYLLLAADAGADILTPLESCNNLPSFGGGG